MEIILPAAAFAVAALGVWGTVRFVNSGRKVGRTVWTGICLAIVPTYLLSFGPACWVNERTNASTEAISLLYYPILRLANASERFEALAARYASLGAREGDTPYFDGNQISWWKQVVEFRLGWYHMPEPWFIGDDDGEPNSGTSADGEAENID